MLLATPFERPFYFRLASTAVWVQGLYSHLYFCSHGHMVALFQLSQANEKRTEEEPVGQCHAQAM